MPRKRGPLAHEEKQYIRNNAGKMSDQQIADNLNRTIDPVRDYRVKFVGTDNPKSQLEAEARLNLRNRPEWMFLKKQFTDEELVYFEHAYSKLLAQFNNDVTATEDKQIFQIIELEIIINSLKADRRRSTDSINVLQEMLEEERDKPKGERDDNKMVGIENQIQVAIAGINSSLQNYRDMLAKYQVIMTDLKGTRKDRIKTIENNKKNLLEYIKELENEEFRQSEGKEIEIMKLAASKEYKRLSNPHTYMDGVVDLPLLTPETVLQFEDNDES
jgi:hypothetical protein